MFYVWKGFWEDIDWELKQFPNMIKESVQNVTYRTQVLQLKAWSYHHFKYALRQLSLKLVCELHKNIHRKTVKCSHLWNVLSVAELVTWSWWRVWPLASTPWVQLPVHAWNMIPACFLVWFWLQRAKEYASNIIDNGDSPRSQICVIGYLRNITCILIYLSIC
jgi:hypothetical protein